MVLSWHSVGHRCTARWAVKAAIGAGVFSASALLAQGGTLAMLDRLQPGMWEIRQRDGSDQKRERFCLGNGRGLIQIRHPRETCQSYVIDDRPGEVTVQYTCRTSGYGRTSIRYENVGLVQLESQGVANGRPFSFSAEGRRVGDCR